MRFTAARHAARTWLAIPLGRWPTGVYFARLTSSGGAYGFAPLVLRPRRLGENRVAVVVPTHTWAAYNFRDVDGDGVGDTWYASSEIHTVDLTRPFLDRGVPPHYRAYDAGFIHWMTSGGRRADFLSDEDLERIPTARRLQRLYDLVVFPGHEEYVTPHVFDIVERYHTLGGNLLFLSANNFYYRVTRRGTVLHGRDRYRDRGRPEARFIGAQYVDWFQRRYPNRPYVVTSAPSARWVFRGTGLETGSRFGTYGIEIDARAEESPPRVEVLARIPGIFGPGKTAEMTYHETAAGAKVFAAGVINFGGSAWYSPVPRILDNLWARLSRP